MSHNTIHLGNDLRSWLGDELRKDEGLTVVHAGHYAIDSSQGSPADHLSSRNSQPPWLVQFLDFTRITWEIACKAVAALPPPSRPYLMTLVNDWQFLTANGTPDRRVRERKIVKLRRMYYDGTPALPLYHREVMKAHGLDDDRIFKAADDRWLFSESDLRRHLARTVRLAFRNGTAATMGLASTFDESGHPKVTVTSALDGEFCLLFCGSTNCAGEVVQLLKDLHDRGVRRFVNLYPYTCMGPVITGSMFARQMFGRGAMKVVNLAVPFLPPSDDMARVVLDTSKF